MEPVCHTMRAALRASASHFLRDDSGSATVWNLTWLAGFGIMGGLAIDSTNAWRHKTMLASTADAAALAGAWELPPPHLNTPWSPTGFETAKDSAVDFARANLAPEDHGQYFVRDVDIFIGHWDPTTRLFVNGPEVADVKLTPINAVRVWHARNNNRENDVQTTLLRFLGIYDWEIAAVSTAVFGVPKCYIDGFVGREGVDLASNAKIVKNVCVHGQLAADINNNIYWANKKSLTTGYQPQGDWLIKGPDTQYDLDGNWVDMSKASRQNLYPPMVDRIPSIARAMLTGDDDFIHFLYPSHEAGDVPQLVQLPNKFDEVLGTVEEWPEEETRLDDGIRLASLGAAENLAALLGLATTYGPDASEDGRTTTFNEVEKEGSKYLWPKDDPTLEPIRDGFDDQLVTDPKIDSAKHALLEDRIYFVPDCKGGENADILLSGVIKNITIITTCKITINTDTRIENSVLISTAGNDTDNEKSIVIKNGAQIGAKTACEDWGGVRMYANGTITTPSSGNSNDTFRQWYGAHLVARTSVQFAGLSDSSKGLSVLAGGEIKIAANAEIGALDASEETTYPTGGCPEDGVKPAFGPDAYMSILVQ